jgi:regulator of sigma E protease
MTVLIFLAILFMLILVHEWGHFIVAKKTGMRVDEFGIGFPPRLFGIRKGETEYTINLLPIGGFVRIFGENAQDASEASQEGKDISRSFTEKNKWAQLAVLFAGVTMNVIFAWLLFIVAFSVGVPTAVDEAHATGASRLTVLSTLAHSPAGDAGIPAGAVIESYDSSREDEVLTPSAFREYSSGSQGAMEITYSSKGKKETVQLDPQTGLIAGNESQRAIGVSLALVENERQSLPKALVSASVTTYQSLGAIAGGLFSFFADIARLHADLSSVAGPVGIVGMVGDAAEFGFVSLIMFTAMISLNLAIINLLPIPALDGGRILFVIIEAALRRDLDPRWVARINTAGFILLISLMVAVTYSDIAKLF